MRSLSVPTLHMCFLIVGDDGVIVQIYIARK